ncbi:MAG TPA: anti-sigma factor [Terrimicrobiaceae bacterium]
MTSEEREELASLYVLGTLEGDDLAAFERELTAHPELAVLVTELEKASTILATSVPQHKAPAILRQSILREIKTHIPALASEAPRRTPFSLSLVPWAIAAGVTICCALLWDEKSRLTASVGNLQRENNSLLGRIDTLDAERARLEAYIGTLEKNRDDLKLRVVSLEQRDPLREIQPVALTPQPGAPAGGQVIALWDSYRRAGALHLKLPVLAPDKDYQLWIITPESDHPVDAGLIPSHSDCITFSAAQRINQIAALAISIEPKGGSITPRGQVIYLGKL